MIHRGDSLSVLRTIPDESVQVCVTSPPYWALRRYDIPDVVFDGDPDCEHEWGDVQVRKTNPIGQSSALGSGPGVASAHKSTAYGFDYVSASCGQCGAWRGQLGQEPTPELFIRHMVDIFREVRRVLRSDGTCWINIGDCYSSGGSGQNFYDPFNQRPGGGRSDTVGGFGHIKTSRNPRDIGLKPKDLVGIPWMLAFALRDDGWYLRAENIWAKGLSFCEAYAGSVMPESVTDRPTRSHEQVFLLTKSERYFYDHEAVKERGVYPAGTLAAKGSGTREGNRRGGVRKMDANRQRGDRNDGDGDVSDGRIGIGREGYAEYDGKRNLRTVWAIGVEPFDEAHFATYPPDLVIPCLKAGTSQKGACVACGAPWRRIVEYEPIPEEIKAQFEAARSRTGEDHGRDDGFTTRRPNYVRKRIGERWEPTCECGADVEPCMVLDPFAGSGTTGVACELLRLRFTGIDLGYHEMSERRVGSVAPLFNQSA